MSSLNINLDDYIEQAKPSITIFGKSYEVDSDYKKVLGMQRFASDLKDDSDSIRKFLSFCLMGGDTAADEILSHGMPFPLIQKLEVAIMAAMTGKKPEELEEQMGKAQEPSFRSGKRGEKKRI